MVSVGRQRNLRVTKKLLITLAAAFILIVTLGPYLWLFITSFKDYSEVFKIPPTLIPKNPTLAGYKGVFTGEQLGRHDPWPLFFMNSLMV
ncbi:MAG: hypothetical protein ACE5K3_04765, partial [bacterium]